MPSERLKRFSSLACCLTVVFCCCEPCALLAQRTEIVIAPVSQQVIIQRLQRLRKKNAEREIELSTIFHEAGCETDQLREQVVRCNDPPNVICTLPGSTNSLIIVAAHFDHADAGMGAVDDWSGASLLPSLYQALRDVPRGHTFVFIGFTDEEDGLLGSNYYVKHFPKDQRATIEAVVNLECLGLQPTKVWAHVANEGLLNALVIVANALHAKLGAVNVEQFANDDTQAFRSKGLPVITLHSVSRDTLPSVHSSRNNNLAAIHVNDLYESYRLTSEYLAYLDTRLN